MADVAKLVMVTSDDYILGMSDLTGELMRYATNGTYHYFARLQSLMDSTEYGRSRYTFSSVRFRSIGQDAFRRNITYNASTAGEEAGRDDTIIGED